MTKPAGPTRRALRKAADRLVLSTVNAFVHFAEGSAPAGKNSARKEVVFSHDKLTLYRVKPLSDEQFDIGTETLTVSFDRLAVPLVLIPPLMVRPYVYDLRPDHSLVRTLRNACFDVFVIDFGVPDEADLHTDLDTYVLDYIPTCIDQALRASGAKQVSVLGYSFGGIFALLHCGTHRDERVKNIVTVGAPVDFGKMAAAHWMARLGAFTVAPITSLVGNIPGWWSTLGFKLMAGTRSITRWIDFVNRLDDAEYLRTFDTINTWINELIPYPRDAFRQVVKDVVAGNKLMTDELTFGGKRCELGAIHQSLLAFAGRDDNVALPRATHAIMDRVGSTDKELVEVTGGHVAIIGGNHAPHEVWDKTIAWLEPRSLR
ncbi:MAG TPA: alpha/beta fold hydrolase [Polyangiaceae bacterium]|jgi:class III poly(R)-hydroxyalkanoic acid synthase PhaC subunit|nr:alpha/beta fold hydrolase [Polyangiaceae bacterium]